MSAAIRPLLVLALLNVAHAASPAVRVSGAWVRAVPGADVAAAYFVLYNTGPAAVSLRAVRSPLAGSVSVHETRQVNGQSQMRPRAAVPIGPGARVAFAPEGLHVMLSQLHVPLAVGLRVPLILEFSDGQTVELAAPVRPPDAR